MSLRSRARAGDRAALETMFRQFLPPDERIDDAAFLGLKGVFGIGSYSFGAVTDRRVASLQLSPLGGARYRDGYHEHINSSAVVQPSKVHQIVAVVVGLVLWLAALSAIAATGWPGILIAGAVLGWMVLAAISIPVIAALFYRFSKSGLVLIVREGVLVYCFTDRRRLGVANELASRAAELRDRRLAYLRTGKAEPVRATRRSSPRPAPRSVTERALNTDPGRVISWASAVVLAAVLVRLYGFTLDYRDGVSVWDVHARLVWVLPVGICASASAQALIGGRSPQRLAGIAATVGSALVIGLQVLFDVGAAMATGASGLGVGFWVSQLGGLVALLAAAAMGLAAWVNGLVTVSPTAWHRSSHERVAPLVRVAGVITALGAVMPWIAASGPSGTEQFWGMSPAVNVLYALFFACSTALCLAVPVVVTMTRPRAARAGLLFGWSAALLGWAVGYELEGDFLFGFRLFEAGVVASLVLALLLLADWNVEAARHPTRTHAAWPPPPPAPHADVPTEDPATVLQGAGDRG